MCYTEDLAEPYLNSVTYLCSSLLAAAAYKHLDPHLVWVNILTNVKDVMLGSTVEFVTIRQCLILADLKWAVTNRWNFLNLWWRNSLWDGYSLDMGVKHIGNKWNMKESLKSMSWFKCYSYPVIIVHNLSCWKYTSEVWQISSPWESRCWISGWLCMRGLFWGSVTASLVPEVMTVL